MKLEPQEIEKIVWNQKYRQEGEETIEDTNKRVCEGVYKNDPPIITVSEINKAIYDTLTHIGAIYDTLTHIGQAWEAINNREWCPAGRIHAGAGTDKDVTWINCFVSPTIEDSIATESDDTNTRGIMESLIVATRTQQMEGGIGMDFTPLRPRGALIKTRRTAASGPVSFMEMWNAMGGTMEQSNRRGAMMATLRCDHPDIEEFIEAKHTLNRLTNFNVSVLITDEFMEAVENDLEWTLWSTVPRLDGKAEEDLDLDKLGTGYIYKQLPARELWDKIIQSTYVYAEPGVIFIDRINKTNNLWYCETISSTNPCGEQPLPPNGDCNLGAINLAVMVEDPFTTRAKIKYYRIAEVAAIGMRFLDNVLNETPFPTDEQRAEAMAKRRTGLGITGLGNMLQQLGLRYGSDEAVNVTRMVMRTIRDAAYIASIELAKERGPFPLYDRPKYLNGEFIKTLPEEIKQGIALHGIRNGVLLTIAPTGTTSIYYGNVSSGLEPTFAWSFKRKMRQPDGSLKEFEQVEDYGYRLYKEIHGVDDTYLNASISNHLPDYMVTAQDLTVDDHLVMQAACQEFIDSSTSKTINCPEEISYEDFREVYTRAYDLGLKGCTTYRPNPVGNEIRGSILSVEGEKKEEPETPKPAKVTARPKELPGKTYKIKWPGAEHAMYITVNDFVNEDGTVRPFEVFINTKDAQHQEWIMALTRCISAIFRKGGEYDFIIKELQEVHSSVGGAWVEKKYVPSLVAQIGAVLEGHIAGLKGPNGLTYLEGEEVEVVSTGFGICPKCSAPALAHKEGCDTCMSCGFSNCG